MTEITAAELHNRSSEVLNRVQYRAEQFTITRFGRVLAVLVPVEDWQELPRSHEGCAVGG